MLFRSRSVGLTHALLYRQHAQHHVIKHVPKGLLSNKFATPVILYGCLDLLGFPVEFVERDVVLLVVGGGVLDLVEDLRQSSLKRLEVEGSGIAGGHGDPGEGRKATERRRSGRDGVRSRCAIQPRASRLVTRDPSRRVTFRASLPVSGVPSEG